MATLSRGYSFGATESVTNAKLHSLVDSGTVGSIVNADIDAAAAIANSKLNLASISQAVAMSGGLTLSSSGLTLTSVIAKMAKGADVASVAGTMTLGDDGNYFDITGTNAITSITAKTAGTVVVLQFDSTASMVDGSNLKLAGNFQGAAESQIALSSDGTNWFEISRSPNTPTASTALSGSVIQMVNTQNAAYSSGTTVIPYDDTAPPQNTEGDEYMTKSITPSNSSNLLRIEVVVNGGTTTNEKWIAALFQDSTANALCSSITTTSGTVSDTTEQLSFSYWMTAGTTSSTTFKVRVGPYSAATFHFNGQSGASTSGFMSGTLYSSITITEIKA